MFSLSFIFNCDVNCLYVIDLLDFTFFFKQRKNQIGVHVYVLNLLNFTCFQKFNQRKSCLDPEKEKEVKAFHALTKDHMSSDEDDPNDHNAWMSRPPAYRSDTLKRFLQK